MRSPQAQKQRCTPFAKSSVRLGYDGNFQKPERPRSVSNGNGVPRGGGVSPTLGALPPSGPGLSAQLSRSAIPEGYRPRGAADPTRRHIPNSIAMVRRRLIVALARTLPRCPCCNAPPAKWQFPITDAVRLVFLGHSCPPRYFVIKSSGSIKLDAPTRRARPPSGPRVAVRKLLPQLSSEPHRTEPT